jgi:hypothetical protein
MILNTTSVRALAYTHTKEEIQTCCLHEGEWGIVRGFGDLIDQWDAAGSFDAQARAVLRGLGQINGVCANLEAKVKGGQPY